MSEDVEWGDEEGREDWQLPPTEDDVAMSVIAVGTRFLE